MTGLLEAGGVHPGCRIQVGKRTEMETGLRGFIVADAQGDRLSSREVLLTEDKCL